MEKFVPHCPKDDSRSVRWLRAIPTKGRTKTYRCNVCHHIFEAEEPMPEFEKPRGRMVEFLCLDCDKVTEAPLTEWETGESKCGICGSMNVMNT